MKLRLQWLRGRAWTNPEKAVCSHSWCMVLRHWHSAAAGAALIHGAGVLLLQTGLGPREAQLFNQACSAGGWPSKHLAVGPLPSASFPCYLACFLLQWCCASWERPQPRAAGGTQVHFHRGWGTGQGPSSYVISCRTCVVTWHRPLGLSDFKMDLLVGQWIRPLENLVQQGTSTPGALCP